MSNTLIINTYSEQDTYKLGKSIGLEVLKKLSTQSGEATKIGFMGNLGAGKTILIKGIIAALNPSIDVTSPTYTIINEYELEDNENKQYSVWHVDLYRINQERDLEGTGFWEATKDPRAVMLVEWIDRLPMEVHNRAFKDSSIISISYDFDCEPGYNKNLRVITIQNKGIFNYD